MKYSVVVKPKVLKHYKDMPKNAQDELTKLFISLEYFGAEQPHFKNYSKLSENKYHCHLAHKWVACWYHKQKTIEIEVYYVGSRESAPY